MSSLQEKIAALDSFIESGDGLEINCIRGYPDFARPDLSLPLAALFYAGSGVGQRDRRIGAGNTGVILSLAIYASDESNLFALAERLAALRRRPIRLAAGTGEGADYFKVYFGDDERQPPGEDDPKELRHVTVCRVEMIYE